LGSNSSTGLCLNNPSSISAGEGSRPTGLLGSSTVRGIEMRAFKEGKKQSSDRGVIPWRVDVMDRWDIGPGIEYAWVWTWGRLIANPLVIALG
jgi:hypothetical protein